MPSTYQDRLNGITTSVAVKPPCVTRTIANITLYGEQTIDGVSVVADDRVLVVAQDDPIENGIWVASATDWARADDFDGSGDIVWGTLISVLDGSTLGGDVLWKVTTDNPIVIGTTSLTIQAFDLVSPGSFGTMANQNATAVNIDGGTVDGTVVGGSSAAAGTFTTAVANSFRPNSSTSSSDGMHLSAAGTVGFNANGAIALKLVGTASAVNYVTINPVATGGVPTVRAAGAAADVSIGWAAKGTGAHNFYTQDGATIQFRITNVSSAANYLCAKGATAGGHGEIYAEGSDTDINVKATPKGAGVFQLGNSGSFASNNSHSVSLTALAPLAVLTTTVKKWLIIKDDTGTPLYIPAWGA